MDLAAECLCRGGKTTGDVVAGVNFAREHNLRLVVKSVKHSYLKMSNTPNLLLI